MFIPALLNRMSIGPSSCAAWPAKARPAATSATSTERCMARLPRARISPAVSPALPSSSKWQNAMSAPSAANASAVARPIPREPPVIRAIFPASFMLFSHEPDDGLARRPIVVLRPAMPNDSARIFLDYTQEQLDQAYDQLVWAPQRDAIQAEIRKECEAVRQSMPPRTE